MADQLGNIHQDAVTGNNAAINVVVLHQSSGEYEVAKLDVTPEQSAQIRAYASLQGQGLNHDKLEAAGLDVKSGQPYYAFSDVSEAIMADFNGDIREATQLYNELSEIARDNYAPGVHKELHVHDYNGINGVLQGTTMGLELVSAEARSYAADPDAISQRVSAMIDRVQDSGQLAAGMSRIAFQYDKEPAPGFGREEPDYDQFRNDSFGQDLDLNFDR